MLQQGTILNGTYRLIEEIGSGGGGIVYKAYHERLKTYVVVKQIKDRVKGILDSRGEADILKNIKHARLPRIYDFLEADGEIFTVMDYIPGVSLQQALEERGRFPQRQVLGWARQLADALSYLHSQKPPIIHSDIKPANIMLTPEGDICLIDFNVSLVFDADMRTSVGISGGYSPPEQYQDLGSYSSRLYSNASETPVLTETLALGQEDTLSAPVCGDQEGTVNDAPAASTLQLVTPFIGRGVDERSDIYSLGAALYHLLTGVKPSLDFGRIRPVSDSGVRLSEGFSFILNKMMALDPKDRYQNGRELLDAFNHIYELDSEYRGFKRRELLGGLSVLAVFVGGALLAASGWMLMGRERTASYNRNVALAEEQILSDDFSSAERTLSEAFSLLPHRIEAYETELLRLYSMGDYEAAVRYGQDIINNPAYVLETAEDELLLGDVYYLLGNAYFEQEDYRNAISCFSLAVEKNRNNSLYFRDYAIALAKTGSLSEAEHALEAAIELGLGEDSVYIVQGELAFAEGRYEEAFEYLEQAVRAASDDNLKYRAVLLCARACQQMGDAWLDQEIALLEEERRSLSLPASMHIDEQLADAYVRKAESAPDQAQAYYGKALEIFNSLYAQGYSTRQMAENIAILYQQTGDLAAAETGLLKMTEDFPNDYRAYKRLAFLEADKQQRKENRERDYGQMKAYYDKAKELYEASGQAADTEMNMLDSMMEELREGNWL